MSADPLGHLQFACRQVNDSGGPRLSDSRQRLDSQRVEPPFYGMTGEPGKRPGRRIILATTLALQQRLRMHRPIFSLMLRFQIDNIR
jgi:hypothetical protein